MDRVLCFMIDLITFFSGFSRFFSRLGIGSYEEWRPGEKLKILLVGYNGARNTGSDVRVSAIARQLKEVFGKDQVKITVMTLNAGSLEGYFDEDVTLLTFSSFYPWQLYRACTRHHAAILCEGSTLKSTFANALTLFMCEAAGIMGRQGKPCVAYGSEVGQMEPFLKKAARRLCKDTYFITRNQSSLEELKKLGLQGHSGTDTAWLYNREICREEAEKLLVLQGWDKKKPVLGIAVIDPFCWPVRASLWKWLKGRWSGDFSGQYDKWYFFSDSPARKAAFERYIQEIARGAGRFIEKYDAFPVVIGMERLDENACRLLAGKLPCEGAMFLSGSCSADIMTGILRRVSLLVTSRYHAAVLSMGEGCPLAAVSMDERLNNIMGELSLDRTFLLSVEEDDLGEKLFTALCEAWNGKAQIRRQILEQTKIYRRELDEMGVFLKRYIQDALQKNNEKTK